MTDRSSSRREIRKLKAFAIGILMGLLLLPIQPVMAEEAAESSNDTENVEITESGVCGDISWQIDSAGLLTLSGSGDYEYSTYSEEECDYPPAWYDYRSEIKSVIVHISDITSTAYMFHGLCNVESIDLTDLDTSKVTEMQWMFDACESLKHVDISNFDTTHVTNMERMFFACSALEDLDISNLDTANVTSMCGMFAYCQSLKSLDFSNFNTANVTTMGGMFVCCYALENLDLSNFNTANVTNMGGMFNFCLSLKSLDIANFNTANVTTMESMFCNCQALTQLDLSSVNTSGTTSMGRMFSSCQSLTELDLSSFDTSNVTSMEGMFAGCSSLEKLDVSSFNTPEVTDMCGMFDGCESITELDLNNFDTSKITNFDFFFHGCSSLETVNLSSWNTSVVIRANSMFSGCKCLQSLDLNLWDVSNVIDAISMFEDCENLQDLNISSWNLQSLEYMYSMFRNCSKLCATFTLRNTYDWGDSWSALWCFENTATDSDALVLIKCAGDCTYDNIDCACDNYAGGNVMSYDNYVAQPRISTISRPDTSADTYIIKVPYTDNADTIKIYRSTTRSGNYSLIATVNSNGKTVSYADSGIDPTRTYYYKVRAYHVNHNNETFHSKYSAVRYKLGESKITNLTYIEGEGIIVEWTPLIEVDGYNIMMNDASYDDGYRLQTYVLGGDKGEAVIPTAVQGVTYNFYLIPFTYAADGSEVSKPYSEMVSITVPRFFVGQIDTQPASCTVIPGGKAIFNVVTSGGRHSYQWYYYSDSEDTYVESSDTSAKTSTFTMDVSPKDEGKTCYCVIYDKYSNELISDTAAVHLYSIGTLNDIDITDSDDRAALEVPDKEGFSFNWYYRESDTGDFTLSDNHTHSYDVTGSRDGTEVYCIAVDSFGNTCQSNTARVINHQWDDGTITLSPTCTESGLREGRRCTICGEVSTTPAEIPALGHSFTNYVYNNDATSLSDGTKTAICDRGCGETQTVTAPGTKLNPPTPVLKSAVNKIAGISLTWAASPGAENYRVYYKLSTATSWKKAGETTDTNYVIPADSLISGSTYSLAVSCISADGTKVLAKHDSAGIQLMYLNAITKSSLTLTNVIAGIRVSWNEVPGAETYKIYRRTSDDAKYTLVQTAADEDTITWTDEDTVSGTKYYYYVRACSGSTLGSYESTSLTALGAVTSSDITMSNLSSGLKISWNAINGASGYYIYRKVSSESSYRLIDTVTDGTAVTYTDTDTNNGTTYIYRVRAFRGSVLGSYSGKTAVRLSTPAVTSLTSTTAKKAVVKWSTNAKATGYQIRWSTDSSFASYKSSTITSADTASKTISNLTPETKYYVRVRSYKTVGGVKYYSGWSTKKSVTVAG